MNLPNYIFRYRKRCQSCGAFFIARPKILSAVLLYQLITVVPAFAGPCDLGVAEKSTATSVEVAKVIDGDTVRLTTGKLVRLIGINTPEIDHKFGLSDPGAEQAKIFLQSISARHNDRLVLLEDTDKVDRHGRLLAHLFAPDGANIQSALLERGMGTWIVVPDNFLYLECYRTAEAKARSGKLGIWQEQYKIPRQTSTLNKADLGFQWIQGNIIRIGKSKNNWWLNFRDGAEQTTGMKYSRVTLRINKDDLHYFKEMSPDDLINKEVRVKGWLTQYKGQFVMSLRHPASLEIVKN